MWRFVVVLLVCLMLTACGTKTASPPTNIPSTTTSASPPTVASASPTTKAAPTNTATPNSAFKAGITRHSMNFEGRNRTYTVYLPPAIQNNKPLPLVMILHPATTNADLMAILTGLTNKAEKENFIAVYPNGTGNNDTQLYWNVGNCCSYALFNRVNDVGFLGTLMTELQNTYPIDPKRIYVVGMSNGGMMSYLLAATFADKIAAIGAVVGSMSGQEPPPKQPVSVISFNGTDDNVVPYNGSKFGNNLGANGVSGEFKPVSFTTNFWVKNNGTSNAPVKDEKGNILKETYPGGKNGTEVILYTIKGGGHEWPGGLPRRSQAGDEISATDIIWEFLKDHPKS